MADITDRAVIIELLEEAVGMFCVCDPKSDQIAKERIELAAEKLGLIKNEKKGVFISRDIAKRLLHEVDVDINNSIDDPRMGGRAPAHFYELHGALQAALSAGKDE